MNFIKLIYLDESFVADFMQIISGGELKQTTELITNVSKGIEAQAGAGGSMDDKKLSLPKLFKFLSGANFSLDAKAETNMLYSNDKMVKNILENTLLADFMVYFENDKNKGDKNRRCKSIVTFDKIEVRPEPNSFTFYMLVAPFMSIVDGDFPIDNNDNLKINLQKIGQAITEGRGYYEFIGNSKEGDVVLRFNISAFRNNYTMSDLPRMQLTYYAIYVGDTSRDKLQAQNEFEFGTEFSKRINIYDLQNNNTNDVKMKVYDVILAGVGE